MQLVDTHAHLDFDQYDGDRGSVIERCREEMVAVVNSGTNVERNEASLELAEENDFIQATLGFHPTYIKEDKSVDRIEEQIRDNEDRIVGIGEIGLDYHHVQEDKWREEQEEIFIRFLELAEELQLPVVLHTRDAEKRVMEILEGKDVEVILHTFNGSPELAEAAVERGYTIGVSTQVLYSNRVQDIVETVPLDSIVLETDAPFLYQGDRNAPWNVGESAEKISEIKGEGAEDVAKATTENASEIFGLEP
ncbi:MAG: TatD family hydrolase [Candidatus Nanohaloarchaeota archaeon QJJ-7]|nr:TatD family hydrolase [Candidatus Nanohaloarchaeota archaeon QJJ-7]